MANIFEFLSKDGNITLEKARKSRQMQFHDKTAYVWMGILPLKKRVNRDKCSFATKQRMFGVFAIGKTLRYRGIRFPGSPVPRFPGSPVPRFLGSPVPRFPGSPGKSRLVLIFTPLQLCCGKGPCWWHELWIGQVLRCCWWPTPEM